MSVKAFVSELDQKMRAILERATPDTILADTRALMALGFPAWTSFSLLERTIIARQKTNSIVHRLQQPTVGAVTVLHNWHRHAGAPHAQWVDYERDPWLKRNFGGNNQ